MKKAILLLYKTIDAKPIMVVFISLSFTLLSFAMSAYPLGFTLVVLHALFSIPNIRLLISDLTHEVDGPETASEVVERWFDSMSW